MNSSRSITTSEPRFMNEEIMTQIQEKPSLKSSFYSILGLEFTPNQVDLNEKVIKKAVRTKSLLYHPDKLKPSDDAEFAGKMFHLLQLASVTLGDAATRIKYDDLLRAESNRETRLKGLDDARRKARQDLEEREKDAASNSKRFKSSTGQPLTKKEMELLEKQRLKEEGQSRMASLMRQKLQSKTHSLLISAILKDGPALVAKAPPEDCTIRVKWTKESIGDSKVDKVRLENYYSKYGEIDTIILKEGKKSAAIVFKSVVGCFNAIHGYSFQTGAAVTRDPAFTEKLVKANEDNPEAFRFLALKRDPHAHEQVDLSGVGVKVRNSAEAVNGGGYEKDTLDRLKEQERMRKQMMQEEDA